MVLNVETKMWLWTLKRTICSGSEHRIESGQWLWTPNEAKHGSKRQNEWCNGFERLTRIRLWTLNWGVVMMALNVETENTTRIALNTDIDEWWLWMLNEDAMMALKCQNEWRNGSERLMRIRLWSLNWGVIMMAPNAEAENMTRIALNIDTDKWWLWMPNEDAMMALKCRNELHNGSERLMRIRLWTSNWGVITMAPNDETN